jgi:histidinol-phosphate phosphatase family protein
LNDFEWVVLAGGKGTRSENPSLAKILQNVNGHTLLDLLIVSLVNSGCTKVTFVLKHHIESIQAQLEKSAGALQWEIHEDAGLGPVSALKSVVGNLKSRQIGCILGDVALDAPLDWFLRQHLESGASASVVVRQSTHLRDSDAFALTYDGKTAGFYGKNSQHPANDGQLWGASGILFAETKLASELLATGTDVASSLVEAVGAKEVNCIRSSFYHKDSGTPGRLNGIRRDHALGLVGSSVKRHVKRSALFVDRDGTVMEDIPAGRSSLALGDIDAKVIRTISVAKDHGIPVFLVTNQPAIAKGFLTLSDVYGVHNKLQAILAESAGIVLDDVVFCPHHPESGHPGENREYKINCECRKPGAGMLTELAKIHRLDLNTSILLGDTSADEGAATKLSMKFIHVHNYTDAELASLWASK